MPQFHATVSGLVQGVCFRYYTGREAKSLGLRGFVKNCPDGTVEVLAQGEKKALEGLAEWLHKGPSGASVKEVKITWEKEGLSYKSFSAEH
jgi:acylphosphatase